MAWRLPSLAPLWLPVWLPRILAGFAASASSHHGSLRIVPVVNRPRSDGGSRAGPRQSTTLMGQWYATAMFWKPQVALFVNEPTLLPVLMPLAPAATLLARFPQPLAAVLAAHGTPDAVIDEEQRQMRDRRLAKTANRSVVGIMNEFTFLAGAFRDDAPAPDLQALAIRLAATPCGPLYNKHISPDRELAVLMRSVAPPAN